MKQSIKGFSLLEVLLVLAIASAILVMSMNYFQQRALYAQIDRTAQQMEQILTAGLTYYVAQGGKWPNSLADLKNVGYLPATLNNSPFQSPYVLSSTTSNLYVYTEVKGRDPATSYAYAQMLAGKLPLSYTSNTGAPAACTGATCRVYASVNIPGQNLNNARAANFVGMYYQGGCVPVPECPVDPNGNTMVPQIFVVPASARGLPGVQTDNTTTVWPITGYTAYARGGTDQFPPGCSQDGWIGSSGPQFPGTDKNNCTTEGAYTRVNPGTAIAKKYWRVCMNVNTEKGDSVLNDWAYGDAFKLIAITRCEVKGEPSGSGFNFYTD